MAHTRENLKKILPTLLFMVGILTRWFSLPYSNLDMTVYNLPWYDFIHSHGIRTALGMEFSNYAPPYTYLLALATLTNKFLAPLIALKLIPTCFDVLGALLIYRIVKISHPGQYLPSLAAGLYFSAPTVMLNSSYWGQADSIYTTMLLACLYFVLREKPLQAMAAFGMAVSIKAQGVFLLPFLGIMTLRKRIPLRYYPAAGVVYLLALLPVVALGRPFKDLVLVYFKQAETYKRLATFAPNLYSLFPNEWYTPVLAAGLLVTGGVLVYWVKKTAESRHALKQEYVILVALISVSLMPFLLPKMHSRYFYAADVLSILLVIYRPALWFVPVLYQVSSFISATPFLFNVNPNWVAAGFVGNATALAVFLKRQREVEGRSGVVRASPDWLPFVVRILAPVAVLSLTFNMSLTPAFIRLQYALPGSPAEGIQKSEGYRLAGTVARYMTNQKDNQYVKKLAFDDGRAALSGDEVARLDALRELAKKVIRFWKPSLGVIFLVGLLAWAGEWQGRFYQALKEAGSITMLLTVLMGILGVVVYFENSFAFFEGTGSLALLFPGAFWKTAWVSVLVMAGGGGFLLRWAGAKRREFVSTV